MTTKPLVTVLMAVYNGGEYLRSSVQSVLNQSYRDFEFLIVNDCSTDDSVNIIKSFHDKRIVIHNNENNMGQTKSLNIGLKLARGKYVARMDADDMAFPLWIEKLLSYIIHYPEYSVVSSWAVVIDEIGTRRKLLKTPLTFSEVVFHMFFGNAINHVGSLFSKDMILSDGGYNEEFRISQDFELWSSLVRNNHHLTNISDPLVAIRVHESSQGYVEEKKRGLHEMAETIYRNVNAMTKVKISLDEAVKLRMFYRFPGQLTSDEFDLAHNLYAEIFQSLRDPYKLRSILLNKKIRRQMLIPYCKRAMSDVENMHFKSARKVTRNYQRIYGFYLMPFLIFLLSFFGKTFIRKLPLLLGKWQEKTTTVLTSKD